MDLNIGLTQALSDGTNTYIYGVDRIAQVNGGTEYFLGDALGSVRQLTNNSGAVTYASAYDPYGVMTQSSGASQSAYGFTAEYTSQGLVYLRARMYSPGMGRFLTRDVWRGSYNQPLTFNKWNYTNSNPINWIDPSGRITENDNTTALIIAEDLRIRFNVSIIKDWGYLSSTPIQTYGLPIPLDDCDWHYGYWRSLNELEIVRSGIERLAATMGGYEKFKSAMKNRPVEITRVGTLPIGLEKYSGLAFPEIPLYFAVDGLMLPNNAFDSGDTFATYTVIHELGHVWDVRSNLSLSINMALHLGNTKDSDSLFYCLSLRKDPAVRFACAMKYWEYDGVNNEPAPGDLIDPYANRTIAEDWAEAVAYTTYGAEYTSAYPQYNDIMGIRRIFVETMMRDLK